MKYSRKSSLLKLAIFLSFLGAGVWFIMSHTLDSPGNKSTKKVLKMVVKGKVPGLDPRLGSRECNSRQLYKIFEGLVEYHYLKRPYEFVPNLAAKMPEVSQDGLIYTFKLREDIYFHDNPCFPNGRGRQVTASDVVYSIKRTVDPKMGSSMSHHLIDRIVGLDEWIEKHRDSKKTDYDIVIEGIQAVDKWTVRFKLKKTWAQFLPTLTKSSCFVVAKEADDYYKDNVNLNPVGTGPFIVRHFNPQDNKIVFDKNPKYRKKLYPSEACPALKHLLSDAGKQLPLLDQVIVNMVEEDQPIWLSLLNGDLDTVDLTESAYFAAVPNQEELKKVAAKKLKVRSGSVIGTWFIGINRGIKIFEKSKKLRQALSLAFDRKKYNEIFHKNNARLASSILPPGVRGFDENFTNPNNHFDPDLAKQLLAQAGYPDGKDLQEITLDIMGGNIMKKKAEFFKRCMAEVGIRIKIIVNPFQELIDKMHKGTFMLSWVKWGGEFPDGMNFFQLFYGPNQERGINLFAHSHPTFDQLYLKASSLNVGPELYSLYRKMNEILAEEMAAVFLTHKIAYRLSYPWVKNYAWSIVHKGGEVAYIDLDTEMRSHHS